ncbi:MAG: DUF2254 domain-containing protein [Pseudomonadota bacterium]
MKALMSLLLNPIGNPRSIWRRLSLATLAKILGDLQASYWLIPFLCVLFATISASYIIAFDAAAGITGGFLPRALTDTQPSGARALLSVIAGAVIGVTGVMFSLTMVAVSFASGQYGPRLIGNFMSDRGTQISLGTLIGTFVYCVLVLRAVEGTSGSVVDQFVPHHAVAGAMLLTFISVGVTIFFIHHVPESINVSKIIARLGQELEAEVIHELDNRPPHMPLEGDPSATDSVALSLERSGYLQSLDVGRLQRICRREHITVWIHASPGDYVYPAMPVLDVRGTETLREETEKAFCACFALGNSPTLQQNPTFIVQQLAEVAIRALSAGVNDPYTAIDCLRRLEAAMEIALVRSGGLSDAEHNPMGLRRLTFLSILDAGFGAIAPYAAPDPLARGAMIVALERLKAKARSVSEENAINTLIEVARSGEAA